MQGKLDGADMVGGLFLSYCLLKMIMVERERMTVVSSSICIFLMG